LVPSGVSRETEDSVDRTFTGFD
jgi:hypothetical protein